MQWPHPAKGEERLKIELGPGHLGRDEHANGEAHDPPEHGQNGANPDGAIHVAAFIFLRDRPKPDLAKHVNRGNAQHQSHHRHVQPKGTVLRKCREQHRDECSQPDYERTTNVFHDRPLLAYRRLAPLPRKILQAHPVNRRIESPSGLP